MKDTIIILLIEVLYLYNFGFAWWLWVLVMIVTVIIGFSIMVAKASDRETLELIKELYENENKSKDPKDA